MSSAPIRPGTSRKWYGLAIRHLRMAVQLRDADYADGAVFHVCHAYECALSAFVAKEGHHVPPDGRVPSPTSRRRPPPRVYLLPNGTERPERTSTHVLLRELFEQLAQPKRGEPLYRAYLVLRSRLTTAYRNNALYYRYRDDRLPAERYSRGDADLLLQQVQTFIVALRTHV